jgi:hypothetical protein
MNFGFGDAKPTPCSGRAASIASAVIEVVKTKKALDKAMRKVPNYTAQWSDEDYYADELEAYYRAADKLEEELNEIIEEKNYV